MAARPSLCCLLAARSITAAAAPLPHGRCPHVPCQGAARPARCPGPPTARPRAHARRADAFARSGSAREQARLQCSARGVHQRTSGPTFAARRTCMQPGHNQCRCLASPSTAQRFETRVFPGRVASMRMHTHTCAALVVAQHGVLGTQRGHAARRAHRCMARRACAVMRAPVTKMAIVDAITPATATPAGGCTRPDRTSLMPPATDPR